MLFLPRPWRVAFLSWWRIHRVMHPAVPIWWNQGGIGFAVIRDPAPRPAKRSDAGSLFIVLVAVVVFANEAALAANRDACAPRIATPPAENLAENAHDVLSGRNRMSWNYRGEGAVSIPGTSRLLSNTMSTQPVTAGCDTRGRCPPRKRPTKSLDGGCRCADCARVVHSFCMAKFNI